MLRSFATLLVGLALCASGCVATVEESAPELEDAALFDERLLDESDWQGDLELDAAGEGEDSATVDEREDELAEELSIVPLGQVAPKQEPVPDPWRRSVILGSAD